MRLTVRKHGNLIFIAVYMIYIAISFIYPIRPILGPYLYLGFFAICYFMLLVATAKQKGKEYAGNLLLVSIALLFFVFFFIYLQSDTTSFSLLTAIEINYRYFFYFFPLLLVYSRAYESCDTHFLKNYFFVILSITCITTIIGTVQFDAPCRALASFKETNLVSLYMRRNIGGYGFIYAITILLPVLVYDLNRKFSFITLITFLLCTTCIIRAEFTTALLLAIIAIACSLIFRIRNRWLRVFTIMISALSFFLFERFLEWGVDYFGNRSYDVTIRFKTMLQYFGNGAASGDLLERQNVFLRSWTLFLNNPIFGSMFGQSYGGGHSEVLDYIGHSGLFGVFIFITIIIWIKKLYKGVGVEKNRYLLLVFMLSFILAIVNTFLSPELFFVLFFIPILLFRENKVIKTA